MSLAKLKQEMIQLKNPEKAKVFAGFFKTKPGQYGAGDYFLGLTIPIQRELAKKYTYLPLLAIEKLLQSKWHEHRLTAGLILTYKYSELDKKNSIIIETKKEIFDFYLNHATRFNNWDLVDSTAHKIIGAYLDNNQKQERTILYKLAKSDNLWERRIAMIATFQFIKQQDYKDALAIAELLLKDEHDLIHKAVGWMLREVGKHNQKIEEQFLQQHYRQMPRTMLRYAIEKFPESKRKAYLKNKIAVLI
jgi:3-methyladenine DNA glycosylase AlkD